MEQTVVIRQQLSSYKNRAQYSKVDRHESRSDKCMKKTNKQTNKQTKKNISLLIHFDWNEFRMRSYVKMKYLICSY
jgi:Zn-finger nucleic acid-binding protein